MVGVVCLGGLGAPLMDGALRVVVASGGGW